MPSLDLGKILADWDYEPNQITVRKVIGDDGAVKIQMRLDLGLLQMEANGRPDGRRPHGCESLLTHHEKKRAEHLERNGTDLGFELSPEECQTLREESVQYYHRYLAKFVLEDFGGVANDTARNLKVLDLCRECAREESDRLLLEQYRPYLIMMNTRAQAHIALRKGAFKTAMARVKAGLTMIREIMVEADQEEEFGKATEVLILVALRNEIGARLPANPIDQLETELQKALQEERYEDASVLRDRMETMKRRNITPSRRRRR